MIARTVRLDADVDLLAVAGADGFLFEQHGAGLAGRGVAARLSLEEAPEVLAAIRSEDEVGLPGCGPVAFGALPFSRAKPGEVVVPSLVVGRTADGARWVTTVGPIGAPTPPIETTPLPRHGPDGQPTCGSRRADRRRSGSTRWPPHATGSAPVLLDKVVLARELVVEMSEQIDVVGVLARLRGFVPVELRLLGGRAHRREPRAPRVAHR